MPNMDAETQKRIDGLPAGTGKALPEWFTILQASGLEKHSDMLALLKSEHGVSHGFANFIALMYRNQAPLQAGDEVIVPAVSWPTTFYPLDQYGLHLRRTVPHWREFPYDLRHDQAARLRGTAPPRVARGCD